MIADAKARVLALDTATIHLGWAVLERADKVITYVDCGVLDAPASWTRWRRLQELHRDLVELIADYKPTHAAIEGGVNKHARSALAGGESRGIALATLFSVGIGHELIAECAPAAVKRVAAGSGRATKTTVQRAMAVRFGLRVLPLEDAADALAIGVAALCGVATMPKRRLAKVESRTIERCKPKRGFAAKR